MNFGVAYYPEQWDKKLLDEDLKRISNLGCNTIRIGEFAWHLMEKKEGEYDFSFFDLIIKKAKDKNIKVIFGTPTATFPAWLCKKHPTILSRDIHNNKRVFGSRRQYCFNSDIYLEYSNKIVSKLINHYKNEEAIISWQVDNEFGHEGSDDCYCEICQKKFQIYLEEKYKDINILNETYGTIFWGQTYNSFKQIATPQNSIVSHNPTLRLDWIRFRSDSLNKYANSQIMLVKKLKGKHQKVTTNLAGGSFLKLFDHEENTKNLDIVSYDNYPVWGGLQKPISSEAIAMSLDFVRGLQEKNFWILEQLIGAQGHDVIGYLPRPKQAKMWSYQAFAHGCESMMWFRYRGATKGAEQYCYGILDQNNKVQRKYKEVKSFIKEIKNYEKLFTSPIDSKVALIYDFDNIWSWKIQQQSSCFDFTNEFLRLYTPFYKNNINIDVIPYTKNFDKYDILVLPVSQIIDNKFVIKLKNFLKKGGSIIFSFRSGIKDKNNNIHFGITSPCLIKELCGIEIEEIEALGEKQELTIKGLNKFKNKVGTAKVYRDLITPINAKALYNYTDPFYKTKACITKNKYKKGDVYYIGSGVDENTLQHLIRYILKKQKISIIKAEEGLEVYKRLVDGEEFYIITNHTQENKKFKNIKLKPYGSKIIKL